MNFLHQLNNKFDKLVDDTTELKKKYHDLTNNNNNKRKRVSPTPPSSRDPSPTTPQPKKPKMDPPSRRPQQQLVKYWENNDPNFKKIMAKADKKTWGIPQDVYDIWAPAEEQRKLLVQNNTLLYKFFVDKQLDTLWKDDREAAYRKMFYFLVCLSPHLIEHKDDPMYLDFAYLWPETGIRARLVDTFDRYTKGMKQPSAPVPPAEVVDLERVNPPTRPTVGGKGLRALQEQQPTRKSPQPPPLFSKDVTQPPFEDQQTDTEEDYEPIKSGKIVRCKGCHREFDQDDVGKEGFCKSCMKKPCVKCNSYIEDIASAVPLDDRLYCQTCVQDILPPLAPDNE